MIWTGHEVVDLLAVYRGQRYLGAIRCFDCWELVFETSREPNRSNLLTLFDDGRHAHEGVADPARYIAGATEDGCAA